MKAHVIKDEILKYLLAEDDYRTVTEIRKGSDALKSIPHHDVEVCAKELLKAGEVRVPDNAPPDHYMITSSGRHRLAYGGHTTIHYSEMFKEVKERKERESQRRREEEQDERERRADERADREEERVIKAEKKAKVLFWVAIGEGVLLTVSICLNIWV